MDTSPAAFLLQAANLGSEAVVALNYFKDRGRISDIASSISLSASFLSKAAREIEQHKHYFKANFEEKFDIVPRECKANFELIRAAVEKVRSYKKGEGKNREDVVELSELPSIPWFRLLWGLGMDGNEVLKLEESFELSVKRTKMLQQVVSLVILQKIAHGRELTPSERLTLTQLKKNIKNVLRGLRESKIASLVSFSLHDRVNVANLAQLNKQTRFRSEEDASNDDVSSITKCNSADALENTKLNQEQKQQLKEVNAADSNIPEPPKIEDKLEMYRAYNGPFKRKETVRRLFGMPFTIDHCKHEVAPYLNKVPVQQDDIENFLKSPEAMAAKSQLSTLDALIDLPKLLNCTIYHMINQKYDGPRRARDWSVDTVVRRPNPSKPRNKFFSKRPKTGIDKSDYIIVLRGVFRPLIRIPDNYGPRCRPVERKYLDSKRERTTKVELTQEEAEVVVNDFLATFSTLYDGVAEKDRGAPMKAIALPEDDSDYDSDDTSSTYSRSIVDD